MFKRGLFQTNLYDKSIAEMDKHKLNKARIYHCVR